MAFLPLSWRVGLLVVRQGVPTTQGAVDIADREYREIREFREFRSKD